MIWTGAVVLGLLVVVGGAAAFRLAGIARDLDRARDLIDAAATQIEAGELAAARAGLTNAEGLLAEANGSLYSSAELDLVGWVPVVSQNLSALRDSVGMALTLVDGGRRILEVSVPLEDADGDLEVPLSDGAIPIDVVVAAQAEVEALARALPGAAERPRTRFLLGPVTEVRDRLYDEADRRREQLDNLSRALDLLADMSGANGPRRYLIAVANTAEMRGAGGMILSYGVLEGAGGDFDLGAFGNIDELTLGAPVDPAAVGLPDDYLARWTGLDPTRLWRNVTLTPDFALAAPVMEAMFTQATGLPVDGVIQIDPSGLGAILEGTGPVNVSGVGQVTAENVVDLTLNRAYTQFPDRDQRQEVLGDVAEEVFRVLVEGDYESLRPLGEALFEAAAERHIVVRVGAVGPQNHVGFFAADGALPPADTADYAMLTVQNFSANKLDYYLDTSLSLVGTRRGGEAGTLEATVTVTNTAPADGEASYVFGPNTPDQEAGLYRGIVSLYLPIGARLEGASGPTSQAPGVGSEDGRTVVAYGIDLPAGATSTVTLELSLPPRPRQPYQLTLVPAPRVRPTQVAVRIDAGDGAAVEADLTLGEPVTLETSRPGPR